MEPIPELYRLETIEQLRAIADPLRVRLGEQLARRAMTATQLAEALDLPANKVHYHVRELERVGLVRLVETREKGGILEKYYRLVAGDLQVPEALLRAAPPDESIAATGEILQAISQDFMRAFSQALLHQAWEPGSLALLTAEVNLTNEEMGDLTAQVQALLKPYEKREPPSGSTARSFALLAYPSAPARPIEPAAPDAPAPVQPPAPVRPRMVTVQVDLDAEDKRAAGPRRMIVAGAIDLSRKDLEAAAAGRPLDLNVLGYLSFARDISAELADRAIWRVRHKGKLNASPAVREVIKRKGGGG